MIGKKRKWKAFVKALVEENLLHEEVKGEREIFFLFQKKKYPAIEKKIHLLSKLLSYIEKDPSLKKELSLSPSYTSSLRKYFRRRYYRNLLMVFLLLFLGVSFGFSAFYYLYLYSPILPAEESQVVKEIPSFFLLPKKEEDLIEKIWQKLYVYHISPKKEVRIELSKGSYLEVSPQSSLKLYQHGKSFYVLLEKGKISYLSVNPSSEVLFEVYSGGYLFIPEGTIFSLEKNKNYLRLQVLGGEVGVYRENQKKKLVKKGESFYIEFKKEVPEKRKATLSKKALSSENLLSSLKKGERIHVYLYDHQEFKGKVIGIEGGKLLLKLPERIYAISLRKIRKVELLK